MTRLTAGLALCLCALLASIMLDGDQRPRTLTRDSPASTAQGPGDSTPALPLAPLSCLSYAPYRRPGDAPWHADRPISPEQIREDLLLLQPLTRCVRTYGVEHGLEAVPAIARELGFKVKLGVWIGGDPVGNERGLERALSLAQTYRDVVDLLIVGNEVLLRGELSPQGLVRLLDKARAGGEVPVAYAEVWEFWQRHAEVLRGHVDVVAVHILPYWEDRPIGVAQAAGHVQAVLKNMNKTFAPLPVWLAETGWPAAGRQRGPAVPGVQEQSRFMRDWLQIAPAEYNLIEAFDQPWKRDLEGAMGGQWGILSAKGLPKIHWQGPLPSNIDVTALIRALLAGAVVGGLMGALLGRYEAARWTWIITGLLAGACLGPLTMLQVEMIVLWGRTAMELLLASLYALMSVAVALLALTAALQVNLKVTPGETEGTNPRPPGGRGLVISTGVLLALTLVQALALVLDGRYRPLIWPILIAPAVSLLLAWATQRSNPPGPEAPLIAQPTPVAQASLTAQTTLTAQPSLIVLLAAGLTLCAAALVAVEGLQNAQAVQAGLTWILLALGSVLAIRSNLRR